ncbi:MAG: ATPase, partial [Alphaproteobacteria bacterium CG11_big_fil_rev_8_21_14_0_20_44_7]
MRQVTDTEIKKRLAFDNPWWETGEVEARFRDMPKRAYFDGFFKLVGESTVQRAVVLMGPRRVGKSV